MNKPPKRIHLALYQDTHAKIRTMAAWHREPMLEYVKKLVDREYINEGLDKVENGVKA